MGGIITLINSALALLTKVLFLIVSCPSVKSTPLPRTMKQEMMTKTKSNECRSIFQEMEMSTENGVPPLRSAATPYHISSQGSFVSNGSRHSLVWVFVLTLWIILAKNIQLLKLFQRKIVTLDTSIQIDFCKDVKSIVCKHSSEIRALC